MKIDVKIDGMDALKASLRGLSQKKIKVAAVAALNDAAFAASKAGRAEIAKVFDRPTPMIQRSVVYFKAGVAGRKVRVPAAFDINGSGLMRTLESDRLEAVVDLSGEGNKQGVSPDQVLAAQIYGGQRRHKRHEVALQRAGILPAGKYIIPGEAAKLDSYGNMSSGQINQIIAFFGGFAEGGRRTRQNMTAATKAKRAKGTRNSYGFEYFAVDDNTFRTWSRGEGKAAGRKRMQPGIYMRIHTGFGSAIKPVMIFVNRASYKPRFDFYRVTQSVALREFSRAFPMYLEKLLKERGL